MAQYLLIDRIKVQNANAASGFTWGFPAITHFLGFCHNLQRKISKHPEYNDIFLGGCAVIAHEQQPHTYREYGNIRFTQYKPSQDMKLKIEKGVLQAPPIVEEAKMNMTVSLIIKVDGYLGALLDEFKNFIEKNVFLQRMAGGTVLSLREIELFNIEEKTSLRKMMRRLLPGFVLMDRSEFLKKHYEKLLNENPDTQQFDAWLDFIALKQTARPVSNLIDHYFVKETTALSQASSLSELWLKHKEMPYSPSDIPEKLITFFSDSESSLDQKLIKQWKNYINPDEKSDADWEYNPKPEKGYLVPIMVGYKAISELYSPDSELSGRRDSETDLCFVESVHSIGEWKSVHRIKLLEDLDSIIWNYMPYEQHWYLCSQAPLCDERNSDNENDSPYK